MKRELCYEYLIDGKPILFPDLNVKITENDLDDSSSGRDESGVMHRIVMRSGVKIWEFVYGGLEASDYAYIQSLFKGKPDFVLTYRNTDGLVVTTTAYVSKRSIVLRDFATGEYKNLKFNIIEC